MWLHASGACTASMRANGVSPEPCTSAFTATARWFSSTALPRKTRQCGLIQGMGQIKVRPSGNRIRPERVLPVRHGLPTRVHKVILPRLASVYGGLADCHLERGEHQKSRNAMSKAGRVDLNFNIAVNWLRVWMNPVALRQFTSHQKGGNESTGGL